MIPVFHVLYVSAVISAVHSSGTDCKVTTPLVVPGFTAGILPASAQTLSPRNKSGLGMLSLAASLLKTVSVLEVPKPIFLNR